MTVYEAIIATSRLDGEVEVYKHEKREFSFPDNADEITMRQWTDYQLRKEEAPDWFLEIERADIKSREEKMNLWDEERWSEFFYVIADLITCVVDDTAANVLKAFPAISDGKTALGTLYLKLNSIINEYKPVERKSFQWKGITYTWPKKVVDNMGHAWWGQELTTAEAIEALQIEHVYSAKDKSGKYILQDRVFHVDVALLAVLSHKILPDGSIEQVPLEYNQRRKFIENRIELFQKAPMSICLDMAFFLRTSKLRLASIHISRMRSIPTLTT